MTRLAVAIVALLSALAPPQVRPPSRDTAQAPMPAGTGRISGVVLTSDVAKRPVRHAVITLGAGDLLLPRMTATDDDGRFEFASLGAGNYTLVASRRGYVTTFYGAKKPGRGPGVPIAVIEGQSPPPVEMRLSRGSVITGVVRGISGLPVPGTNVRVMEVQAGGARRALPALEGVTTDDRGVYRMFGLAAGSYIVLVQPELGQGSGELRQVTVGEIQWADQAIASSAGSPGTPPAPPPAAPAPAQPVSYATVYHPGTTIATEATVVTLGIADERTGVDVSLQLVPTAKLSGTVIDGEGRPQPSMSVSLNPVQAEASDIMASFMMMGAGGSGSAQDGGFTLNGVKPGQYTLSVRGTPRADNAPRSEADEMRRMMAMVPGMGGSGAGTHWASQEITVDGRDISGLTLRLQPGMTLGGKFVFDATSLRPPEDLSRVRLSLSTASGNTSAIEIAMSLMFSSTATTESDGTFAAKSLPPGRYRMNVAAPNLRISATSPGTGWMLKSIMWNGRDVADLPLEVEAGRDVTGLVVTLTDRPTELSGSVLDQAGRPTADFPIIVFSTDRTFWTTGSRRVQQGRPANTGQYLIAGLPAGEYFVCAVTDLEPGDLYDPVFLEQLIPGSFKISLAEAEKKVQDLKLAGG